MRQGELEHRTPKERYTRTDKKIFVGQLARVERREVRLHRIRAKLPRQQREWTPNTPEQHHHIAVSQNNYEHIGTFLQKHEADPAVKVE